MLKFFNGGSSLALTYWLGVFGVGTAFPTPHWFRPKICQCKPIECRKGGPLASEIGVAMAGYNNRTPGAGAGSGLC